MQGDQQETTLQARNIDGHSWCDRSKMEEIETEGKAGKEDGSGRVRRALVAAQA